MATIHGTLEDDILVANSGSDVVFAYAGNDMLATAVANATLIGGPGEDLLTADINVVTHSDDSEEFIPSVSLDGGDGNDQLSGSLKAVTTLATTSWLAAAVTSLAMKGGNGGDTLSSNVIAEADTQDTDAFVVITTSIAGGNGHDTIDASSRIDSDTAGYFTIEDHIDGGAGHDKITSMTSIRLFTGGTQKVAQPNAQASVNGGSGGDDIIVRVRVNTDADWYGYASASVDGNDGTDTIDVITYNKSQSLIYENYAQNSVKGGGGEDVIAARAGCSAKFGYSANYVDGGADEDSISAWITTTIDGASGSNSLYGGSGDDRVIAWIGDGILGVNNVVGDDGRDYLRVFGGQGNRLTGGAGNDTMVGGSGDDYFIFEWSEMNDGVHDQDRIVKFGEVGIDALKLPNAAADVVDVTVIDDSRTVLTLAGDLDQIVLIGFVIDDLKDVIFA